MKPIHVAVVGAGQMGVNHLKAYQKREDVHVVGIVDVRSSHADDIAREFNCRVLSIEDLRGSVDAVSVVTPSATHAKVGRYLLEQGIHCLVEKPLAMDLNQCKALVDVAAKMNTTLVVGHIEEYNNGFRYLKEALERNNEKPEYIFCERLNHGSQRIVDADVVLDLMIHDLGCIVDLMGVDGKKLQVLNAAGYSRDGNHADTAVATLKAPSCLITLQASRICHHRHREFSLHTKNHSYFLNYMSQQVSVYREGQLTSQTNHPWMSPLECEIDHFIHCIRDPSTKVLTSGIKAGLTMQYVEEIQNKIYKR